MSAMCHCVYITGKQQLEFPSFTWIRIFNSKLEELILIMRKPGLRNDNPFSTVKQSAGLKQCSGKKRGTNPGKSQ